MPFNENIASKRNKWHKREGLWNISKSLTINESSAIELCFAETIKVADHANNVHFDGEMNRAASSDACVFGLLLLLPPHLNYFHPE